ncbi:MAG TPA: MogA/MoaB family molybdenum cofactor biosynthesis protein [Acidimicrobiia bacterium]|nr:MogA/MoaB family molybdenum cofactor biosynthesis protein [Acidimicrobiia bacterium]
MSELHERPQAGDVQAGDLQAGSPQSGGAQAASPQAAGLRAKVLTVSDGVAAGAREDRSGRALVDALRAAGYDVVEARVTADGVESVADALADLTHGFAGLIVTTGGTGFGPRDLTPEGTMVVLDRNAPGLVEAIRRASDADGRGFGMLSRAEAGTVGEALVCNLAGSSSGALEGLEVILPVVAHALDLLAGGRPH